MSQLANCDSLTGLYCRSAFESDKTVPAFIEKVGAVYFIDFDQFSRINREYGRAIGDFVLAMSADRLTNLASVYDSMGYKPVSYRYEGDRFVKLLLADTDLGAEQLTHIGKQIQTALHREIRLSDQTVIPSCTITAALRHPGLPIQQIVTEAQLLSEEFKYQGTGQFHILRAEDGVDQKVS